MDKKEQLVRLRTRKLGILIYDARMAARQTQEECARAIGIPVADYIAFEQGQKAPPLPILEGLAYFLNIPLDHFWGGESLLQRDSEKQVKKSERLRQLRDRLIGTRLHQERGRKNISLEELAAKTTIPENQLQQYELGQKSIPLPELELITGELGIELKELFDQHGPIGSWRLEKETVQKFEEMPPVLKEFVCKPVNRPYLELAMRLSELSVEKLRAVAEGLLEITY